MNMLAILLFCIAGLAFCFFILKWMWSVCKELFSYPFIKILLCLIAAYGIYALYHNMKNTSGFTDGIKIIAGIGVLAVVLVGIAGSLFSGKGRGGGSYPAPKRDHSSKKKQKNECPICGGRMIWVSDQRIPTDEFDDYEKGHWENDYSMDPNHPTSVWVKEYYHDRRWKTVPAHYQCMECGYER